MVNIHEENLQCHHVLFIQDVVSSEYNSTEDSFKVKETGLEYRKARLNGVIVFQLQVEKERHVWLDDGTAVIKTIIPPFALKRTAKKTEVSLSITVIGTVKRRNNENIIQCLGFRVHEPGIDEFYHLLRAIQDRPKKRVSRQQKMMFQSLSSEPSPQRLTYLQSPIREHRTQDFIWSPTHPITTSTPLRKCIMRQTDTQEEDDEFEFSDLGEIDLIALETEAIEKNEATKRKFDDV